MRRMKSGIETAAVHRQHSRMTDAFDVPAYIAAAVSELLDAVIELPA